MLKVLLAIFLAIHGFSSVNFKSFDDKLRAPAGPLSIKGEGGFFSALPIKVECKKIKALGDLCGKQETFNNLGLPKVESNFSTKLTNSPTESCTAYFENLLKVDPLFFWNSHTLIKSFYGLLEDFKLLGYASPFKISVDSFAFQPSSQSFIFIEIDKLNIDDGFVTAKKPVTPEDEAAFKRAMVGDFFDSLHAMSIFIQISDLNKAKEFGFQVDKVPLYRRLTYDSSQKVIVDSIPKPDSPKNLIALTLLYTDKSTTYSNSSELKITFGDFVKNIVFYTQGENFLLYICRKKDLIDSCYPVAKNDVKSKTFDKAFDSSFRFDVEIREGQTDALKKVLEIFVFFEKKDAATLIPSEVLMLGSDKAKFVTNDDVIFCETRSTDLNIRHFNNQKQSHFIMINTNNIEMPKDEKLYQISPSYLGKDFDSCLRPNSKVFLLQGAGKKVIIIKEKISPLDNKFKLSQIKIIPPYEDNDVISIDNCPVPSIPPQLLYEVLSKEQYMLKFKGTIGIYPSKLIFKSDEKSVINTQYSCNYQAEGESGLALNLDTTSRAHFYFNFNLQPETSTDLANKSVIYLNKDQKKNNQYLKFSKFAWPNPKNNVLFFSFFNSKENGGKNVVHVVYSNDSVNLFKIPFAKLDMETFTTFPSSLMYIKDIKSSSSSYTDVFFENMEAAYLSDTEVVYQLEIENFSSCKPVLEHNKLNYSIKINCKSTPQPVPITVNEVPEGMVGLKKVLKQAKKQII